LTSRTGSPPDTLTVGQAYGLVSWEADARLSRIEFCAERHVQVRGV